ncbi:MAG: L,D-transpeptidase family protein [Proteobacteria bacterium]|nr:L,D-transpeptidase family protein [Pseudomonadota bacterium]
MVGRNPNRREMCVGLTAALLLPVAGPLAAEAATTKTAVAYPDMVGELAYYVAGKEDTLLDLARTHKLGYVEMVAANPGIDPWIPGAGTQIYLPTAHLLPSGPRKGVLLNLVDQRLYYFPADGKPVETYPIGTGQEAWGTPLGSTEIIRKKRDPTWYVPKSIQKDDPTLPAIVGPGPDNPLGSRAIYLGWKSYLIHGTNNPWGVGRRVSHGCVRMYPEDIEAIFPRLPVGTPVTVVSQEAKLGWHRGQLMLEVHPNLKQNSELEETGKLSPATVPEIAYRVSQAAGNRVGDINWKTVKLVVEERRGIPVPILRQKDIGPTASEEKTASGL